MSTWTATHLRLPAEATQQDWLVTRSQARAFGLSDAAIAHRLAGRAWQALLPAVYLAAPGEPSRRQLLIAALLYAGDDAAIDDVDACRFHGIRAVAIDDDVVRVVVPQDSPTRSHGFVAVRRTSAPIKTVRTQAVRYIEPAAAAIAASRRLGSDRAVLALLSDAVQRGVTTYEQLVRANVQGPPRNARRADLALRALATGVHSVPEEDFRRLAAASTVLPPLLYNAGLRLPTGRVIRPDALAVDAGLVHETNGRGPHRRDDLFEDMQTRHDAMTEAGLTVLHNSPRRLRLDGRSALAQFERCYLRLAGSGLPPGVELLP